ncbi:Protein of unknown function [Cotesia congregata]|uniref:Uncharacterized protein n=1 Tax=Cotesia congregata TaxID=51543 RepID=A0A8J2MG53_COTCN|nr:Protein of unknown function [Cotesia congregata]
MYASLQARKVLEYEYAAAEKNTWCPDKWTLWSSAMTRLVSQDMFLQIFTSIRQLLEMCFADELKPVAVTVDLIDVVYEIPKNETAEPSIIVIDDHFLSKVIKEYYPRHPSFVLSGDSIDGLGKIIREIKSAEIWNPKSLFVIVGTQCQDSIDVLKLMWRIEAISSFFICQEKSTNETLIFTFNPFSNYAPEPWQQVEINGDSKDRWTIFSQFFVNDAEICESIKFDKSVRLDRFPIKSQHLSFKDFPKKYVLIGKLPDFENWPSVYKDLFETLHLVTNSTPESYVNTDLDYRSIQFGTNDLDARVLQLKFVPLESSDVMAFYDQGSYVILTRKQSTVPVMDEIVDGYFNIWTATMSGFILMMILVVIYVNHHHHLRNTLSDMLSLMLDIDLKVPMNLLSMQLSFFFATVFMLIFNPVLEGYLFGALAKPVSQQVDTLEQLRENKLHVYYDYIMDEEIIMTGLWSDTSDKKYLHLEDDFNYLECERILLQNASTACVISTFHLNLKKIHDDIHLSKYSYFNEYEVLFSRKKWPLKDKFDKVAMNFVETGHADYHRRKSLFERMLQKKKIIDRLKTAEQYEQLDFGYFEYDYLIIPLISSWTILVLIIEIIIKKFQTWNKKRRQKSISQKSQIRQRIAGLVRRMTGCCRSDRTSRVKIA